MVTYSEKCVRGSFLVSTPLSSRTTTPRFHISLRWQLMLYHRCIVAEPNRFDKSRVSWVAQASVHRCRRLGCEARIGWQATSQASRNRFCACNILNCEIRCHTCGQGMSARRRPRLELCLSLRRKLLALLREDEGPLQVQHLLSLSDRRRQAVAMHLLFEMPWWRCPPHPSCCRQYLDQGALQRTLVPTAQLLVRQLLL